MSLAEAQVVPRAERRRSERVPLALPLTVRGVSLDAKPFQEEAFTLSVSAHGALVALSTTVTLGQALFVKNPQTQEEVGAWVTRFGIPRGGLAQVGIELVEPNVDFWSGRPRVKPIADSVERRVEQQIHVLPDPRENAAPEHAAPIAAVAAIEAAAPAIVAARSDGAAAAGSPTLLQALEQTLQHAAERVVDSTANARLSAAVSQAAETIESFGRTRIRQLEERAEHFREQLVSSAREDFLSRLKADVEQTEGHLRTRASELLQESALKAHSDFANQMRDAASQGVAQFGEQAAGASTQHLARFAEQAQASATEARAHIDSAAAALAQTREKISAETNQALVEAQQRIEALTSQCKEVYEGCEARLRSFQEDIAKSREQELQVFREHLKNVLTTLLGSLS
jgi:chemotaxis protein histidine kinase CheA